MAPIWLAMWISIGLLVLSLIGLTFSVRARETDEGWLATIITGITTIAFTLATVVTLSMGIGPEYRLWKATVEKRIMVEDARARADSATELARAEIERAKGTAEANLIVADSITEPYLRYLYITGLSNTDNSIIYVPTEAGLPILEAGRR